MGGYCDGREQLKGLWVQWSALVVYGVSSTICGYQKVMDCWSCQQGKPGPGPGRAKLDQHPVGVPLERMAVNIMGPTNNSKRQ